MRVYIAAIGDANNLNTFGGTPFFLLDAGKRLGIFHEGLALESKGTRFQLERGLWNLYKFVTTRSLGGYQFSEVFLNAIWRQAVPLEGGACVINLTQLYPKKLADNPSIKKWFYIDQTLNQLFHYYNYRATISDKEIAKILAREREQYNRAQGIIVTSNWAARSLALDYRISSTSIHVVPRGANLDPDAIRAITKYLDPRTIAERLLRPTEPVRLLFVGKDWKRKGLDRLIAAFTLARSRGVRLILTVIGPKQSELPSTLSARPDIIFVGRIDKSIEIKKYVDILGTSDVGCLLSRAEAGGISLREFHAAGLATLSPDTGGSSDFALMEATTRISPEANEHYIAEVLCELATNREKLIQQRVAAIAKRESMTWESAVRRIGEVLANTPRLRGEHRML